MTNPINFPALLDDALDQLADHGREAHVRQAAKEEIKRRRQHRIVAQREAEAADVARINAAAPAAPAPGARAAARKARKAAALDELLTKIAAEHLGLETLETRRSDRLDFHDLSVWGVRDALIAAYEAGRKASR